MKPRAEIIFFIGFSRCLFFIPHYACHLLIITIEIRQPLMDLSAHVSPIILKKFLSPKMLSAQAEQWCSRHSPLSNIHTWLNLVPRRPLTPRCLALPLTTRLDLYSKVLCLRTGHERQRENKQKRIRLNYRG